MTSDQESSGEEESVPVVYINMEDKKITVNNPDAQLIFENGYFGQWINDETLLIEPEEILLLLDRGRIEVVNVQTEENLSSSELVAHFSNNVKNLWSRYLVYKDLRNRGYVVRDGFGFGFDFRVYDRGEYGKKPAKYVVYGVQEGSPLPIEKLKELLRFTQSIKRELVLGVIDRSGDMVYYSVSRLFFSPR